MFPRRVEDYRTLLWAFVLTPAIAAIHFLHPNLNWLLLPVSCYFAIAAGVIAHNHMHRPTLRAKWANELFSCWLSIFYGYPIFAWQPTHNLNHHRFVNRPGDATITWRYTNKHNAWVAGSYFFVSAYFQSAWIKDFIVEARHKNPTLFRRIVWQYVLTFGAQAAAFVGAIGLYGPQAGLRLWACSLGIPAFAALWTIMLFNYVQHVHTDAWSAHNHSRNFEGRLLNFLLFGNGYHSVHHENAGLHWADAARAHAKIRPLIDDRLCHGSMFALFFRQYLLALVWPSLGTVQVGRAPFDAPVQANGTELAEKAVAT